MECCAQIALKAAFCCLSGYLGQLFNGSFPPPLRLLAWGTQTAQEELPLSAESTWWQHTRTTCPPHAWLDTQATFAKLFADIGVEGDARYAQVDALLENGPPPPTAITSRHVQALRADMRAEMLSHAAGLTSHSTLLVYGKAGFLGLNEAGHGRSTVGLTRARGATIIMQPPDPANCLCLLLRGP